MSINLWIIIIISIIYVHNRDCSWVFSLTDNRININIDLSNWINPWCSRNLVKNQYYLAHSLNSIYCIKQDFVNLQKTNQILSGSLVICILFMLLYNCSILYFILFISKFLYLINSFHLVSIQYLIWIIMFISFYLIINSCLNIIFKTNYK